ncbi:MAG: hypothetical protein J7501_00590 [Bdellovibrio sp.]|nr:hypothetical protein [Bdellovibrio sp.]
MKLVLAVMMLVGNFAFAADMGDVMSQGNKMVDQAKAKAQDIMAACKEDKVKYCDKYNEIEALKQCLKMNQANLSAGCKASMGLK